MLVDDLVGLEVEGQHLRRTQLLHADPSRVHHPQTLAQVAEHPEHGGHAVAIALPVEVQVGVGN